MKKLTPKQQRFAEEFVCDFNGTAAAIRAGYSRKTARFTASQNLTKPNVAAFIEAELARLREETGLKAERVIEELRKVAFSNLTHFVRWDAEGVTFLDSGDLTANQSAAISDVSQTITQHGGTRRIKLHDKPRALEMLGRYFSLFTDKVEHTHRSQIRVTEIREHYSVYPEEDE